MPSKRMVPVQQLSDAGEDLVRLAAAKDAEIAALEARELDQCPACFWHPGHNPDEWFREEADLRSAAMKAAHAEIAALTKRFAKGQDDIDRLIGKVEALDDERETLRAEIAALTEQLLVARSNAETWRNSMYALEERVLELTEQRDRAMKVVEALDAYMEKANYETWQIVLLARKCVFDADAAAKTAPSLSETP